MGRPIATASNIGQGWRKGPKWTAADFREAGMKPHGEVNTSKESDMHTTMPKSKKGSCCFPTGNKHRGKAGSSDKRRGSGGMDNKHRSPLVS